MKKYLMTGVAALAMCAAFTSCSHDIEQYSQEELNEFEAQKIINNYNQAFIATFGKPASNQTWGFSGTFATRTRSVDVNHNQWYSTASGVPEKYGKLEEDPVVTDEERMGVFRYMNKVDNRVKTDNIIWNDYFVSQVWDGGTNYILNNVIYGVPTQSTSDPTQYDNSKIGEADNKITDNGISNQIAGAEYTPLTTSFADQNGATANRAGGDYMDYLFVNETGEGDLANGTIDNKGIITGADGWVHINNFNSSNNFDPWYAGKTWMTNHSGTYDFAYNQSNGGTFFSHKYLIIPGTEIFANDPAMLAKYGQYYYVCFDFEKPYTDAEKAKETTFFYYTPTDNNNTVQSQQKISLPGYYTNANIPTDAVLAAVKANNGNYVSISNVSVAGYNYGSQHFDGDNNYTDWIVRISPARYKTKVADLRIMAEDLSATEASDFDFNDIVFDVFFAGENETETKILVRAAGGTLPLRIKVSETEWQEVHGLWGLGTGIMINTGAEAMFGSSKGADNRGSKELTLKYPIRNAAAAQNITIQVQKTLANGETMWMDMLAPEGEPAAKFAIPAPNPDAENWCRERTPIQNQYEKFVDWVQEQTNIQWWLGSE